MRHARDDYNRIQDPAGKIGQDEPVFLLRAQDDAAPDTVAAYADLIEKLGADPRMVMICRHWVGVLREWQASHKHKVPDMPPLALGGPLPTRDYNIPRRADMLRWTPAERAIYDALEQVEALPADTRLSKAVTLLAEARQQVADYVDGISRPEPPTAGPDPTREALTEKLRLAHNRETENRELLGEYEDEVARLRGVIEGFGRRLGEVLVSVSEAMESGKQWPPPPPEKKPETGNVMVDLARRIKSKREEIQAANPGIVEWPLRSSDDLLLSKDEARAEMAFELPAEPPVVTNYREAVILQRPLNGGVEVTEAQTSQRLGAGAPRPLEEDVFCRLLAQLREQVPTGDLHLRLWVEAPKR